MPTASKVLVVDDIAENRALAKATLEDEGYEVILAETGAAGLVAFSASHPDCVLLDVRMPGINGFEVCRQIRALPGGDQVPIVFLTALRDVDTFDQALRAGGDDFLTRPVRPTELIVRVQAALKLKQVSAELSENINLLKAQRDDLLRLQLQKERLTSFVVHDLKNPINAMDLHAQLLLADGSLSQRSREAALHIRSEARSLLRLVLNLLDISKSEEGQLTARRQQVELGPMVSELLETFEIKARAVDVQLVKAIETPSVLGDPDLLRRVFENLLDNALRHAPPRSQVRLGSRAKDGMVEVFVADAGPGIPEAQRQRIFERFVQLEERSERLGRGLGLAFCKLAVEAQGGTLTVGEAHPGAVFSARFPSP